MAKLLATVKFHYLKNCLGFSQLFPITETVTARIWKVSDSVDASTGGIPPVYCGMRNSTVCASSSSENTTALVHLNGLWAEKTGLSEGDQVWIQSVSDNTSCLQVELVPLSIDDWEIVELNANYIEQHLLDQVQVVYDSMVLPFWIEGSICVFLKVGWTEPSSTVSLLSNRTEAFIAPVSRSAAPKSDLQSDFESGKLSYLPLQFDFASGASVNRKKPQNSEASGDALLHPPLNDSRSWAGSALSIRTEGLLESDPEDCSAAFCEECFAAEAADCLQFCRIALHLDSSIYEFTDRSSFNNTDFFHSFAENISSRSMENLRFGHLIVTGGRQSGRSSFVDNLCRRLYRQHFVFYDRIDCRALRGKKPESVEKRLNEILSECHKFHPGVIILDDIDQLCGRGSSLEQLTPGAQIINDRIARALINTVEKYTQEDSKILVIGTAKNRQTVNSCLVSSRGARFFRKTVVLPALTAEKRLMVLESLMEASQFETNGLNLDQVVIKTDGCNVGDLTRLVDLARLAAAQNSVACLSNSLFDEVFLADFKPIALHSLSMEKEKLTRGWKDIGGLKEVRNVLEQVIMWPTLYSQLYASCPIRLARGVLLYGPSGTGKTLLAGILAKECNLNFISVKGPELLSKYIGASEQSVRETFERARSAKPCLVFFDEFESLAPRRGHDSTGVTDRVVNQLLTELDGVESLNGVFVLAASSRPDLLDPALLRPGRIDKFLYCGVPTESEREEILRTLTRQLSIFDRVDLASVTRCTPNFTGADLKAVVVNAQLKAINRINAGELLKITQEDLMESLEETTPALKHSASSDRNINSESYGKDFAVALASPVEVGQRATLA